MALLDGGNPGNVLGLRIPIKLISGTDLYDHMTEADHRQI